MLPRIIGISGYARSGKDTIGNILQDNHGYTRVAFADILKQAIEILDPILDPEVYNYSKSKFYRVSNGVRDFGRDALKERYPEYRRLLQVLGTEVGRDLVGPDVWVNALFDQLDDEGRYVITDMRFPNEHHRVSLEGATWRVTRTGVGPANEHPSEIALDAGFTFNQYVFNYGTINELEYEIGAILNGVRS